MRDTCIVLLTAFQPWIVLKIQIGEEHFSSFTNPVNHIQVLSVTKSDPDEQSKVTVSFDYLLTSDTVKVALAEVIQLTYDIFNGVNTTVTTRGSATSSLS